MDYGAPPHQPADSSPQNFTSSEGLTREQKLAAAIVDVRNGLTQVDAAIKHGIPKSTLNDRIIRGSANGTVRIGPSRNWKKLNPAQENLLVAWIRQEKANGRIPRRRHVVAFGEQIRLEEGGDPTVKPLSGKWYDRFLQRHPELDLRKHHRFPRNLGSPSQVLGLDNTNEDQDQDDEGDDDDDGEDDSDDGPQAGADGAEDEYREPSTFAAPGPSSSSLAIHPRYTAATLAPPRPGPPRTLPPRPPAAPMSDVSHEAYLRAKQAFAPQSSAPRAPDRAPDSGSDRSLRLLVDKIVEVVEEQAVTIKNLEGRIAFLEAENQRARKALPLEARLALLGTNSQPARAVRPAERRMNEGGYQSGRIFGEEAAAQAPKRRRTAGNLGTPAGEEAEDIGFEGLEMYP